MAPLFESFAVPVKNSEKIISQKPQLISKENRYIPPENNFLSSEVYPLKRTFEKETRCSVVMDKIMNID